MKKHSVSSLAIVAALALTLGGCAATEGTPNGEDARLQGVTTFSIIEDIVNEVGGDAVCVHSIVPLGTDPHEYQPLPRDVAATAEADVIVWNGLNMELGDGWLANLLDATGHSLGDDEVNPHALWADLFGTTRMNTRMSTEGADDSDRINSETASSETARMAKRPL